MLTFFNQKAGYKTFIVIFPHINRWDTTFIVPTNKLADQTSKSMDSINETEKQLIENRTQSFFHYQNPKMKNENSLQEELYRVSSSNKYHQDNEKQLLKKKANSRTR